MKKILSLVLVLVLMLSAMLMIACGGVDEKDFEKDPTAALEIAMNNATGDFIVINKNIGKVILGALEKGSVAIKFDGKENIPVSFIETIFMDSKNDKYVSDTKVTFDGKDYTGKIFVDKAGIALNSQSLLGSDKTLLVNMSTLATKFTSSKIAELFEIPDEAKPEIDKMLAQVKDLYEASFEDSDKDLTEEIRKLQDKYLKATISSETVGEVDCVVVTYTMDKTALVSFYKDVLKLYLDELSKEDKDALKELIAGEATDKDLDAIISEELEESLKDVVINSKVKSYVSKKENKLIKTTYDVTSKVPVISFDSNNQVMPISETEETVDVSIKGEVTYSADKIVLDFDIEAMEEKVSIDLTFDKSVEGKVNKYSFDLDVGYGAASVELIKGYVTHDTASGDIVLSADVYLGDEELGTEKVELKGNLKVENKKVTAKLTSVKIGDNTIELELSVVFEQLDSIPSVPTDAKDIVDLTEEEITTIMGEFMQSDIGALLFAMDM